MTGKPEPEPATVTLAQLLVSQLADPFRIGLIIALVFTMLRTRAQSGTVLPLVFGVIFVAVLIPYTSGANTAEPMVRMIALGLVANTILLGIVLGAYEAYQRFRG